MTDVVFSSVNSESQVDSVLTVLRQPRLWIPTAADYPEHDDWLDRTREHLHTGQKRAVLACYDGEPVGAVVYRQHENQEDVLEIRNLSVVPDARGRRIGSFLLASAEFEGSNTDYPGVQHALIDTKATNAEMIEFLQHNGYSVKEVVDLYCQGAGDDIVLEKQLTQSMQL